MDTTKLLGIVLIASLAILAFGTYELNQFSKLRPLGNAIGPTGAAVISNGPDVSPKGVPKIYGAELKISYDDVSASTPEKAQETITELGNFDTQIILNGKDKERYVEIASMISCEYCCGTKSIIFSNGEAACGCAHSYAMRGLAKYLIKNHNAEYTNDEILEELGKWKALFFPGPMSKKAKVLQENGIELNYINLASNKYRGIENGNK